MNLIQLSKGFLFSISIFLCCSQELFSDTIYQWTDPWGQVKYSRTQVQGSMISELTKIPESQVSTEQQKQESMLKKIQEMKNANRVYHQKTHTEKLLKEQRILKEKNCQILRRTLTDIQIKNSRRYELERYNASRRHHSLNRAYSYGRYYGNSDYDFLENDLNKEIRKYCR